MLTSVDVAVPYIIGNGLLPYKGKLMLGGQPKSNKSWVALNMALDLARGKDCFGAKDQSKALWPVYRPHRVLYFEQEMGHQGTKDRMRPIVSNDEALLLDMYLHTRDVTVQLDTPEGKLLIEKEIESCRPEVVFFDPMAKFHSADENDSQQMGRVLRYADQLIENYGISVVWVHHCTKPTKDNPRHGGAALRGSSSIFGDMDTVIIVNRISGENVKDPIIQLECEMRRAEPIGAKRYQRTLDGRVVFLEGGAPSSKGD